MYKHRQILGCLLAFAGLVLPAVAAPPRADTGLQPVVRYQYGDNPAWARPDLDDTSWPVAWNGEFPAPRFRSDGFFWIRATVRIPADLNSPLAIRSATADSAVDVQEVFVNGVRAGQYGEFPPHAAPLISPQILIFDIPPGTVTPGGYASIALRGWTFPPNRDRGPTGRADSTIVAGFSIDTSVLLHALAAEAQARTTLRHWPHLSIGFIFIVFGIGVLAFGLWSRSRELMLCAVWLVVAPIFLSMIAVSSTAAGFGLRTLSTTFELVDGMCMAIALELLWTVQGFRNRLLLQLGRALWIAVTVSGVLMSNFTNSGTPALAAILIYNWTLVAFNVLMSVANIYALAGRGRNRPVAAAMLIINIGYFLRIAGVPVSFEFLPLDLFQAGFYLSVFTVAAVLIGQSWKRWKEGDEFRIEFAAARELQQQLAPRELPHLSNLSISAAYIPAKDVGGDFYQVFEQPDGSTLLLVGDVSGKGLKAAMTSLLTIGAASALVSETSDPGALLERLNRETHRLRPEGFITCLCVRIAVDGAVRIANAGHLSPYRNGQEVQIESGLPLGIIADVEYPESTLQLRLGDTFTMLSDGVVEAQSTTGELFGFDRTREIIEQPAASIAEAALRFGQQDDITVLKLTFAPARVLST